MILPYCLYVDGIKMRGFFQFLNYFPKKFSIETIYINFSLHKFIPIDQKRQITSHIEVSVFHQSFSIVI